MGLKKVEVHLTESSERQMARASDKFRDPSFQKNFTRRLALKAGYEGQIQIQVSILAKVSKNDDRSRKERSHLASGENSEYR